MSPFLHAEHFVEKQKLIVIFFPLSAFKVQFFSIVRLANCITSIHSKGLGLYESPLFWFRLEIWDSKGPGFDSNSWFKGKPISFKHLQDSILKKELSKIYNGEASKCLQYLHFSYRMKCVSSGADKNSRDGRPYRRHSPY